MAFGTVCTWPDIAYPALSSGVLEAILLAASAFVMLARVTSRRLGRADGTEGEEESGLGEQQPDEQSSQRSSGEEPGSGAPQVARPWEAMRGLGLPLGGERQRVREIRIKPGEEIVVENGRIIVREAKA